MPFFRPKIDEMLMRQGVKGTNNFLPISGKPVDANVC